MDFLPLVQVASVCGAAGVAFLLLLVPTAIAVLALPAAAFARWRIVLTVVTVAATYVKHHLLLPPESRYRPGTALTLVPLGFVTAGLAICKDLDFPRLGREYANRGAALLLVPAWDCCAFTAVAVAVAIRLRSSGLFTCDQQTLVQDAASG